MVTYEGNIDAPLAYWITNYAPKMPINNRWGYIHSTVEDAVNKTGGVTWSQGGISAVEDTLRERYPDNSITSLNSNIPSNNMLNINGEKGMKGTVEFRPEGLLWHITAPVRKDIWYGMPNHIPYLWVDSSGKDAMAIIDPANKIISLDEGLSGGAGEINVSEDKIEVISLPTGGVAHIKYNPQTKTVSTSPRSPGITKTLIIAVAAAIGLIAVVAYFIFKGKKK